MKLFDIETDGFLDVVTVIHCLVIKDAQTGKRRRCYKNPKGKDQSIEDGLKVLMKAAERGETVCGARW